MIIFSNQIKFKKWLNLNNFINECNLKCLKFVISLQQPYSTGGPRAPSGLHVIYVWPANETPAPIPQKRLKFFFLQILFF